MNEEKKTLTVTLELESSLAGFHTRSAEKEGVSLAERLLSVIRKQTEVEQELIGKQFDAEWERKQAFGRALGIPANMPLEAWEPDYEPGDEEEDEE